MRISFLTALFSLVGLGLSQHHDFRMDDASISTYAECSQPCISTAIAGGICSATDKDCMCNDSGWKSNVSTCVLALCTVPESLTTFNASATMCDWPVRNRSHSLVATSTSLYAIMTFIVVARLVFKKFVVKSLSCDDWVMIVTAISATPTAAMAVYGKSNNNLGHDMWTLTVDQITHTLKCFYFTIITYFITTSLVKLTFVTFYIRIFPSVHTRRVLWGTCILICLNAVAFVLVGVFQCTPINAYWARWTEPETRHCIDLNAIAWSNAAINIALDLWILAIPLWELRRLQLHWKKKIGVGLMFSVGAFVTITTILRLQSLISFGTDYNFTWSFYSVGLWSSIEMGVGIFCANMPVLRLMFVWMTTGIAGTLASKSSNYQKTADSAPSAPSSHRHTGHLASATKSGGDDDLYTHHGIILHKSYEVEYADKSDVGLVDLEQHPRPPATASLSPSSSSSTNNPGTAM